MDSQEERENALLAKKIAAGREAQNFINGDLGREILERAHRQASDAMDELKAVRRSNFNDSMQFEMRIIELQSIIERTESFELWLLEIFTDGGNIEQMLLESEE